MTALLDLAGTRYGRLTVVRLAPKDSCPGPHTAWECRCDCGTLRFVVGPSLRNGLTKSCGCLRRETTAARCRTHGHTINRNSSREYKSWHHAKRRCHDPRSPKYFAYGGRGITMFLEWRESFEAFLRDVGPCPPGHTIDRINNNGNYEPGNCRWATAREQGNNKRNNRRLLLNGESLTLADWSRRTGLPSRLIQDRIGKLGWTPERALTTPVH